MRNLVNLGFLLAFAALAADAAVSWYNTGRLIANGESVAHTREVLAHLEGVRSTVTEAETGQRGYLLTGRDEYLKPYRDAVKQIGEELDQLGALTADNPAQQERLAALRGRVAAKLAELKRTVDLHANGRAEAALAVVATGEGRREMAAVRDAIASLRDAEESLLRERARQSDASAALARGSLAAGEVASAALLGLAYTLVRREARLRRLAAEAVRREREWLEVTLLGIGDGVIAADAGGRVRLLNPVAEALTGWSRDEAAGRPVDEVFRIVNEETRLPVENPVVRCLREGVVVGLANHTVLIARDGTERPVDDSGAPLRDAGGAVRGAVLVFRDVTGRRRSEAERALALAREQGARAEAERQRDFARLVLDQAPIPIGVLEGPDYRIAVANPATAATAGMPLGELLGRPFAEAMPPTFAASRPHLERVAAAGEPVVCPDLDVPLSDGRLLHLFVTFAPVAGGILYVALDRTEARRAELGLHFLAEASATLGSSLDYAATLAGVARLAVPRLADWCVVHVVDEGGTPRQLAVAHADPGRVALARELSARYPPDPAAPRGVPQVIRSGRSELVEEVTDAMLVAGARDADHLTILRGLGLRSYMAVPLAARGRTLGVVTFVAADSGRRFGPADLELAEELGRRAGVAVDNALLFRRASEEEERFRLVTENVRDYAIFVMDAAGKVLTWNLGAERILGYGAAEVVGTSAARFFPTEEEGRFAEELHDAAAAGRGTEEGWRVRKDGSRFWASGVVTALHDGSLRGFVKILRDLSERKAMEEELRRRAGELTEADRRKDEFLAMLAHELRNPLAPIRNAAHVLRLRGDDPAAVAWSREVIDRQAAHMTRLVDELLDASRIAQGKVTVRRETVDLAALARAAAEDYRAGLEAGGLALDLDPPPGPVWVRGDPVRLAQVFGNLLANAGKFTDPGGRVTVGVARDGDAAVASVRDTGIGFGPELEPRLFETFAQADSTLARSKGGLGLGLALVKGLVEMHGGTVAASSAGAGRGAEFSFRIPVADASADAAPTAVSPRADGSDGPRRRILLVEDNPDAAASLRMVLELAGHEVELAASGPEGLEAARRSRPEVVLCDLGLPGMTGFEVARALRADPSASGITLVAVSGYGRGEDKSRARAAGFDEALVKPVEPAELTRLLARLPHRAADRPDAPA